MEQHAVHSKAFMLLSWNRCKTSIFQCFLHYTSLLFPGLCDEDDWELFGMNWDSKRWTMDCQHQSVVIFNDRIMLLPSKYQSQYSTKVWRINESRCRLYLLSQKTASLKYLKCQVNKSIEGGMRGTSIRILNIQSNSVLTNSSGPTKFVRFNLVSS